MTFFLVGLWHGPTLAYVFCGLGLGLGASVNKLWQIRLRALLGKARHTRFTADGGVQALCGAGGMAWLAFTIIPFWADPATLTRLALALGPGGWLAALAATLALTIPVVAVCQEQERRALRHPAAVGLNPPLTASQLAAILVYAFLYPGIDLTFVYQAF